MMAYLTLEDGTIFKGESFGAKVDIMGEVVFNTGMTGYQEVLTDPSYCGQIVTMTYPLIGNYGIDEEISESAHPQVRAFVMRELCKQPSNWKCGTTLQEYLERYNIVGLAGIDTRELTRKLRDRGTMHGIITQVPPSVNHIEEMKAYEVELPVEQTTCKKTYQYCDGGRRVAVLDFGLKRNILRSLEKRDCALTVFPALTDPQEILAGNFDGLMLTNGPGNPQDNVRIIENLKQLIGKLPIFGICLGHQLVALAMGAETEKLKYGHRGSNHPVKDMQKNKVYITSQNHGYTITSRSLPACAVVSHKNWNDQTIEGVKYIGYPMFTVQFHPEAAPGPEDTAYLFDDFIEIMNRNK
ncbi:MAG: carbamoyl phosphate synthase small subunit [Christensenella sp.]